MTRSVLLATVSLLAVALYSSCSHSSPDNVTSPPIGTDNAPTIPVKHTTGSKVDSLNGIPGHPFGEASVTFKGATPGESNITGMKRYYYPSSQPTRGYGWFGKHSEQIITNYYFVDDKFAYFVATAYGENRRLLSDEATYLFGKGDQFKLDGVIWQGKKARAIYTQPFSTSGPCAQLEVVSEVLENKLKQQAAARLKAENAN